MRVYILGLVIVIVLGCIACEIWRHHRLSDVTYGYGMGASAGMGLALLVVPGRFNWMLVVLPWIGAALWMLQSTLLLMGDPVDMYLMIGLSLPVVLSFVYWGRMLYPPFVAKRGLRKCEMLMIVIHALLLHNVRLLVLTHQWPLYIATAMLGISITSFVSYSTRWHKASMACIVVHTLVHNYLFFTKWGLTGAFEWVYLVALPSTVIIISLWIMHIKDMSNHLLVSTHALFKPESIEIA